MPLADGAGNIGNNSMNVPFGRNTALADLAGVFSSANALQSSANRLPRFWSGYAMYAFQFSATPEQVGQVGRGNPPRGDSDPDAEIMTPGLNSSPNGAIFFVEPLREFGVLSSEQRLLVHELAHQFGVEDSYIDDSSPVDYVMGAGMYSAGESSTKDSEYFLKNQLGFRAGIYFDAVALDAPEDKLYPIAENIGKIQQSYSMHGVRLLADDLPRLARMFREAGRSDGIFNTVDGVCPLDEWDRRYYRVATRDDDGQLVPLSKAEITTRRIDSRPYRRDTPVQYRLSTLGQLAKHCDGVFIGKINRIKFRYPEYELITVDEHAGDTEYYFLDAEISFAVSTNLFGNISDRKITIPFTWISNSVPKKGTKILFFYTRGYIYNFFDPDTRDFYWEKPPEINGGPFQVMWSEGSNHRIIGSPEAEHAFVGATIAYLRLLRHEKRDPVKYYELLRSLVKSPVWRIRQDAREDLLRLLRRPPDGWDLRPLTDDPELAGIFRDYVRYVVIPKREQSQTDAANGAVSRKPKSAKPVLLLIR